MWQEGHAKVKVFAFYVSNPFNPFASQYCV